ncbi:hypothetical protein LFL96_02485 [Paraburkholderia sp. D15]|uniref:hypothetical protein n=1 Tax=Paraburkholderia sp. D15 TaxID=2880218 RepID=UPI002478E185|nr:hypothetical protein [Paraburkholderia sp. D15]WGS50396.1 hypothetical protein LFL96_02485 [Paraburkholderia sp. D15]WKF58305.1 hypothetical protein HUO10_002803 [Paraburkholderia busanensis]
MSSRHDKTRPFGIDLADMFTLDTLDLAHPPGVDPDMMDGLHRASGKVLQLATLTHQAVARGDKAAAEAARASLEKQLAISTSLIDQILSDGTEQPTTH